VLIMLRIAGRVTNGWPVAAAPLGNAFSAKWNPSPGLGACVAPIHLCSPVASPLPFLSCSSRHYLATSSAPPCLP
jgi:hypothetical protein